MMEIRQATNPEDARHYTTERLRKEYLVQSIMCANEVKMVYTHQDRVIIGGAVPHSEGLRLEAGAPLKTQYFLERRELGIINIGGEGVVLTDGEPHRLKTNDALYVGMGNKEVVFQSVNMGNPAKFFFVSCAAHQTYPTVTIEIDKAEPLHLGSIEQSNERTIYKYIHEVGVKSCQLMMGMTSLKPGNMWNTMPAHLHDRRMETYFYFNLDEKARLFHIMGEPQETRHLVVQNEEAIISPGWSMHSGVGTSHYSFLWAMAGENASFADIDPVPMEALK